MRRYHVPPLATFEAFEAAARHLSFTRAADELALTQSAVSRQIQALESHCGVALFRRLHRALQLTEEGELLRSVVTDVLGRLDSVAARLRPGARPRTVVVTTTPGFAGIWLIPRLAGFTAAHPEIDVRISAANAFVNLKRDGVDVAIRYCAEEGVGEGTERLFGETVFPVVSPKLLRDAAKPLATPADLRRHTLLHMEPDAMGVLQSWSTWLRAIGLESLEPASVVHFSAFDQMMQAAVAGQGVALGRSPLIDGLLREKRLVAPFEATIASPRSYYLLLSDAARAKPEVQQFVEWLRAEVAAASAAVGARRKRSVSDRRSTNVREPARGSRRRAGRTRA